MRRTVLLFVAVGVALLALGASVVVVRAKGPQLAALFHRSSAAPMTAETSSAPPKNAVEPQATPRGDVTIDPRRQQLIGVKTVPVVRQTVDQNIRATGVVRYDETKQADVNVKIEGWIRDLYVDYTGQPIQR